MRHYKSFISALFYGLVLTAVAFAQEDFKPYDVYISGKAGTGAASDSAPYGAGEAQTSPSAEEAPVSSEEARAEVLFSSGTVNLKLAEAADYVAAEEGVYLQAGDEVRTAYGSYVELGFDEEEANIVRLEEDSYAILILKSDEQLELLRGKAFATIGSLPANASFEIRTPTAIVGVRGTDWLTAIEEGATDVEAYDGSPYVRNMKEDGTFAKEEITVSAGYKTKVKPFQLPTKPQKIPAQNLVQWKDKRAAMHQHARDNRTQRKKIPGFQRRMQIKDKLQKLPFDKQAPNIKPDFQPRKTDSSKPQNVLPQPRKPLPLKVPARR